MKTAYVQDYAALIQKLEDPSIEVRTILPLSDGVIMIQHRSKVPAPLATENVAVAAFTTGHARIHLFHLMEEVGESHWHRVLYGDTDSLFMLQRPGESLPKTGDFLGDLTDEYPGKHIKRYCFTIIAVPTS